MLNLFQSNEMSELARVFCERNAIRQDPFEPLTVVVQSFGIGQWLKFQLASHQGISANVDCVLPANFLWRLYQSLISETQLLKESPYDRHRLVWRVMRLITENPNLSGAIRNYLSEGANTDLRLYQLATEITLLFDEYLMYRPDWILDWESESEAEVGHAAWQADLWRLIRRDLPEYKDLHRAALHRETMTKLASDSITLPWRRLSVFGLSTMPPIQLQTFEQLAHHMDVDIFFQNPCAHYWGDIVSEQDKARRSIRQLISDKAELEDEDYLEVGNPLLSSLGKQGREFLELLLDSSEINSDEAFIPSEDNTILGYVKNDILDLTYGGAFADEAPSSYDSVDNTIQIHSCHSRQREVEVLHDEILRAMSEDSSLQPSDVIVMVPDIADYAPFIESIFSGSLNYRIADRSSLQAGTLLVTALWLLRLPQSRLTGPDVMDLLEVPAVMRRFDLSFEDLETLSFWIKNAEIRWEYSGERKAEHWGLPGEDQNTWQFGLKRLLLGFTMSPEQGLWQESLPLEISTSESELLGTLCHILDQLDYFRQQFAAANTMQAWQTLVDELLEEFFVASGDEILDLTQLQQQMEALTSATNLCQHSTPLSYQLLVHAIEQGLSESGSAGFISGGITFATLVPMRSIPFRMVCLLGINDGEYPRDIRPHSFDLIASGKALRGDRSKKLDDRYLFLEALLSAQDLFYASYIGKGVRDNKDRPPSAVLAQLQNYLAEVFPRLTTIDHALQPFNAMYYQGDQRASFAQNWFTALHRKSLGSEAGNFLSSPLENDDALVCTSLNQLINFIRHPGRYFLNQRLGAYLTTDQVELQDVESFELDNLERFWLADEALSTLVNRQDLENFKQQQLGSGHVLPGAAGRAQLDQEIYRATSIYESLAEFLTDNPEVRQQTLDVAGRSLQIDLRDIHNNCLIGYRAGRLTARHQLAVWVNHLAANLTTPTPSIFVCRGSRDEAETYQLAPIAKSEAEQNLVQLISYYDEGVVSPLFLPPGACQTFTAATLKGDDEVAAINKTKTDWYRDAPGAENTDRYWSRLFNLPEAFTGRFQQDAINIWRPILEMNSD